jgi:hypothetical protein
MVLVPKLAAQSRDRMPEIRRLYLAAVESRAGIEPALAAVEEMLHDPSTKPGGELEAVLIAYQGAVTTLRAKHALWPPTRLRHLRDGLAVMDSVVADHPSQAEVRYLRLMSCYYLPGILGRNGSVREDFAALAELLPTVATDYPDDLYLTIARFVLDHGRLSADQTSRLRGAIAGADD